ncbi:hypothetical protein INR49_008941 [Caranx melampygus]|nr:hypothetical protein INR49_008941 [Caranx melampygus]
MHDYRINHVIHNEEEEEEEEACARRQRRQLVTTNEAVTAAAEQRCARSVFFSHEFKADLIAVKLSIRCLRNIIHWNLITAFILRNATWFIVQLTMSPEVHESNVVWCRLVTASFNYFHSTNFFWMFGEGCYLHTAIVLTYSTDKLRKWMFICIGWCIPFPIIVAWAIGKLYYDNEKCWFGKRAGVYTDYIYQGPMILVLVINFIFLFNIVRILMTKLRASTTSETIQYRKAVKATLGFFVSVFYCFLNSEVRSAVRKRFHRWQEQHSIRARMTQAMSIPTSPSRVSFHSIKQSTSL